MKYESKCEMSLASARRKVKTEIARSTMEIVILPVNIGKYLTFVTIVVIVIFVKTLVTFTKIIIYLSKYHLG